MFEIIRAWYHRRKKLKDVYHKHYLLGKMLCAFTYRVLDRVKLDNHTDATLSTFNLMLDETRAVIWKHSTNLNNISVRDRDLGNEFISQEVTTHSKAA